VSIIALYHVKGGVGKTAAAVNLAYLAAQEGSHTLLCDMDPQGSASFYFRIRPSKKHRAGKMLQGGRKITAGLKGTDYDNLDVLPSHISYRNLDIALDGMKRSKRRLKELLAPFEKHYRYIFLDAPPNITLVSENIFNAADLILVPVIPTTLSVLALDKLIDFFKAKSLDRKKIRAFLSMVERRKKMHWEIREEKLGDKRFLKTTIPYSAVVEKMGIFREPVARFSGNSTAAQAYAELWREIRSLESGRDRR
jgi:cellulose biosynthesis protein BcsQ